MNRDTDNLNIVIASLLDENKIMSLATCGKGGPWAAPVIYSWENTKNGFAVYFISRSSSRHAGDIEQNGWAAAAIYPPTTRPLRGLQMEGKVSALASGALEKAASVFKLRFPQAVAGLGMELLFKKNPTSFIYKLEPKTIHVLSEEHFGWGKRKTLTL